VLNCCSLALQGSAEGDKGLLVIKVFKGQGRHAQ